MKGRTWKITKLTSRTLINRCEESLQEFCTNSRAINPSIFHILLTPPNESTFLIKQLCEKQNDAVMIKNKTNLNPS